MIAGLPLDLLCLIALILLSFGLGKKFARWLGFEFEPGLDELVAVGLGLAALSYLTFALAFLGLLYKMLFLGILLALCLAAFKDIKLFLSRLRDLSSYLRGLLSTRFMLALGGLALAATLSNLLFNYAPPTQAREMLYDLTLPKIYLENHRMIDIPYQKEYYYPLQIQMLFLLAMTVKGVLFAKLIHFVLGVLSAALVFSLGKNLFGEKSGFYGAVIFYLMPVMTSLSGAANIDLGTLFYGLLAFAAFTHAGRKRDFPAFLLSGFFAGVCLGTKVTGVTVLVSLLALSFHKLFFHFRESFPNAVQKCFLIGFMALVGFSPWLIRNVHFAGNPIAPFSFAPFGWKGHAATRNEMQRLQGARIPAKEQVRGTHNLLFGDFIFGGGPLLFALFLPGIFAPADPRNRRMLLGFAVLNFAALFLVLPYPQRFFETRYYIVSAGLVAVVAGAGLHFLLSNARGRKGAAGLVLAALVFPGLAFTLLFSARRIPLLLGRLTPEAYLEQKLPFFAVVKFANENLSAGSRVALVGSSDANSFYWNAETITPYSRLLEETEIEPLIQWLKENKITHVLYFKKFYQKDPSEKMLKHTERSEENLHWDMDQLEASHFMEIYSDEDVTFYQVDYLDESNKV